LGEDIFWPTDAILDVWVKICKGLDDTSIQSATENTTMMHIAAEYDLQSLAKRVLRRSDEQMPVNVNGCQIRILNDLLLTPLTFFFLFTHSFFKLRIRSIAQYQAFNYWEG
jgi:hypothetical protein